MLKQIDPSKFIFHGFDYLSLTINACLKLLRVKDSEYYAWKEGSGCNVCEALSKFIVKLRTEQSVKMIELTKTRKFNFYNKWSKVDSVNLNSRATPCCKILEIKSLYVCTVGKQSKHFQLLALIGSAFGKRKISQRLHQTFCRMLSLVFLELHQPQTTKKIVFNCLFNTNEKSPPLIVLSL